MMRLVVTMGILLLCGVQTVMAEEGQERLVRYAIVLGANDGGDGRIPLRFAQKDAQTMAHVLQSYGGIDRQDLFIVLDPGRFDVESAFAKMRQLIANTQQSGTRQEVLVYYSGHSDEQGLLLGDDELPYREFRELLGSLPARVRIAILDSCSSGALSRTKGGRRRAPFLMDSATDVSGHAFMTSASADEAAQESDRIGGSFFTHYLTTGLRGAADSDRNRMVTLNEAYNYAFNETLARTESTMAGPQHASYDFQLKGSGDLVLTDLRGTSAQVAIDETVMGRVFIRNRKGQLIAEINKVNEDPVYIGVEPGEYGVTLQGKSGLLRTDVSVASGQIAAVRLENMQEKEKEETVVRGNADHSKMIHRPVVFGLFPGGISFMPLHRPAGPKLNNFAINFIGDGHHLLGVEYSMLGSIRYGNVKGMQSAGLFNMVRGDTYGLQSAGLFNISGSLKGLQNSGLFNIIRNGDGLGIQVSGLFNIARGGFTGVQSSGLFNIAGEGKGLRTSGLFNMTLGPTQGAHVAGLFNYVDGPTRGMTVSGLANINTASSHGLLAAGLINYNRSSSMGFMGAGLININRGAYHGFQGAGLLNISARDESTGYQGAGLANFGSNVRGMQAAGVLNVARESMVGVQAGLINIGGDVHGAQIGLVNVATGTLKGPQVGLVNVGGGNYFAPTAWVSGSSLLNVGIKFGGRYTYGILGYGVAPDKDILEKRSSLIYGFGGHFDFGKLWLDIDGLVHMLMPEYRFSKGNTENVYKLRPALGYRLLDQLSVYAGPSLNVLVSDRREKAELIPGFRTYRTDDDTNVRLSIDFMVGIQWEPKLGRLNRIPKMGADEADDTAAVERN